MIESDDYEPQPLTVEMVRDAAQHLAEDSVAPSPYPVQVPEHVYDHLVEIGQAEGFEPIKREKPGPNLDLMEARAAALTGVPVRNETVVKLAAQRA